ncbi:nucleotidyltransferase domain-containing protein [Nocardia blacklockiae]|uniref:nucleotidyltransferase domain-containing protein n=1 Tax=Nocardia blacklockiae TaxID=480036 RepID=UPI001892EF41|nr:nucleotidyltransferase domain-containing protein [Nocardia blacklockiae]MBF6172211.1 nucleotidyltransferase domain-containing protein [Nocardia blacklockiae]
MVRDRFPTARAAWLGGSTATGTATATSDLDITVLLAGPPAPYRESLLHDGRPVELFVQTEASMAHFRRVEDSRRRPSTLRLVGHSVVLVDRDGSGARLREDSLRLLAAGPKALSDSELRAGRYVLTDLLDDLAGATDPDEQLVVAAELWQRSADLLLTGHRRWSAGGKRLRRELAAFDRDTGSDHARTLSDALRAAATGSPAPMLTAVTDVLNLFGGRLFDGYRLAGPG